MQTECFPLAIADWRRGTIGDMAVINPRYPMSRGAPYPFVEMAAVGEDFAGVQSYGERRLESSGLARFMAGDTLFAKITPCPQNGKIAFVAEIPSGSNGLGSTEFIVLSPRPGTDPRPLLPRLRRHGHGPTARPTADADGSRGTAGYLPRSRGRHTAVRLSVVLQGRTH